MNKKANDGTSPQEGHRWRIPVAFLCVYFFWGSTFVAIRYSVAFLTPGFVSGFRYLGAGLVLLLWVRRRTGSVRITRADLLRQAAVGLLLLTGNNVLLGWGERYVTAGYAALLAASVPMLIALFETFIPGGVPLNRVGWMGTALGLGGLGLLLAPVLRAGLTTHAAGVGQSAQERALVLGTSILAVAILAWVAGSLLAGRLRSTVDPILAAGWQMAMGGVVNVAIGTAAGGWKSAHWTPGLAAALLWLTVFGSLVGYSAYTYLLARVPVAKVATYAYVNPIVAVGLSAAFLHESLQGQQWVAMGVILAAVAIVTASRSVRGRERAVAAAEAEAV